MFRVVTAPQLEFEATRLSVELRLGRQIALQGASIAEPLLSTTVQVLGAAAATARVPASLDQVARTILELASAADAASIEAIDRVLREPEGLRDALSRLGDALRDRVVVIEQLENLEFSPRDEVASALREQRETLRSWVHARANLVSSRGTLSGWQGEKARVTAHDRKPFHLANGATLPSRAPWDADADAATFQVAVQLEAIGDDDDGRLWLTGPLDGDALRERLWSALPESVSEILASLAVHGRPMTAQSLRALPDHDADAFVRGLSLRLWQERAGAIVVDPAWTAWCVRALPRAEVRERHRVLGEVFAREVTVDDPTSHRAGLAMIEAHRHLLFAGEIERAIQYARHGAELLVGYARDLSAEQRYTDAAAIYERLLAPPIRLAPRLRAYATHYLHFNRSHARPELEPVRDTARGYEASLQGWNENAIFWSRAVRALFLADEPARARRCLERAWSEVPPHPDKGARLIARTARRLAEMGRPVEAIEVLGAYVPDTLRAEDDVTMLARRLEAGWSADRLVVPGVAPLALHRHERFRIVRQSGGWRFISDRLGRSSRCATPIESARDFVTSLTVEVRRLLRAFDRDLDEDDRARKHTLLSMVDLIASGLDAPAGPTTWVYGRLTRDEVGGLWLASVDDLGARYEVPTDVESTVVVGDQSWLAEVDAGPSGVPRGPVRRLEPLTRDDRDTVWQTWRERMGA